LEPKILKSSWQQARGAQWRLSLNQPLLFVQSHERKIPLHMVFVFFPLQLFWLDSSGKIIDRKTGYPFQPFISHKGKAQYVVEAPLHITVTQQQIYMWIKNLKKKEKKEN